MKSRTLLAAVLLVVAPRAFAAETKSPPALPAGVSAVFVEPDAKEVGDIRAVGEAAINRLAFQLVNDLNTALAKAGIESAVEGAHLKNLPMTDGRPTGLPRIKAIKLTSFRLRSSANAPDAADQLALDKVLKELASDYGPPKILVQRIEAPGAPPEWRVYRPVGVAPVCLRCHGSPTEWSAELRGKLARYPDDQATGYRVGEFRGLLRVTVDPAPPPPPPQKAPARAVPKKK